MTPRTPDTGNGSSHPSLRSDKARRFPPLIGESPAFLEAVSKIPHIAQCEVTVLIAGETGTGKEVCARTIHYLSPRKYRPFVPVECGAIPVGLVENELFGHERGAFTDACASRGGLIHEAEGGTLFLDEIDTLPLPAQVKLLRFLQEKEYRPLGSSRVRQANVRVLAATSRDLEAAVREGMFRRELYYRLNIVPLVLPPLRERREDIPLLARHFLAKYAAALHRPVSEFAPEVVPLLMGYEWPGNVRELEHVIERAVVLAEQAVIGPRDFSWPRLPGPAPYSSFRAAKAQVVTRFEKAYIQACLHACQGNITKAAQAAGKNRRAFWQLLRKHQLDAHHFSANGF